MRFFHTVGSAHFSFMWISPGGLVISDTGTRSLSVAMAFFASTFLPPFAPRPLRRFLATMRALTPARLSPTAQVSIRHVHALSRPFRLHPPDAPLRSLSHATPQLRKSPEGPHFTIS